VIASVLLAVTLPLMLIVALVIKWESAGPALVRRACIGRDDRCFQLLEFRTSFQYPGNSVAASRRHGWTRVGLFLYHTRINTLPQLINVLRGDIALRDMEMCSLS
jgi:lipopolysaccharide/colanic/teichoic acid biosynthesis glycosyltransferase